MTVIKPFSVGNKIKHIRTGRYYTVVGHGKVKLSSLWEDCITYQNRDGDQFTRVVSDFDWFVLMGI